MAYCTNTDSNTIHRKDLRSDKNSSLLLKPSPILEFLVNQFDNTTPKNSNGLQKTSSSKYYHIDEMHNIKIPIKSKSLSLFCINACSLNNNFVELEHLLSLQ